MQLSHWHLVHVTSFAKKDYNNTAVDVALSSHKE